MSEFVKTQQELRANLVSQIRETIDSAEAESRGLAAEELTKIDRIEADIRRADRYAQPISMSVAKTQLGVQLKALPRRRAPRRAPGKPRPPEEGIMFISRRGS